MKHLSAESTGISVPATSTLGPHSECSRKRSLTTTSLSPVTWRLLSFNTAMATWIPILFALLIVFLWLVESKNKWNFSYTYNKKVTSLRHRRHDFIFSQESTLKHIPLNFKAYWFSIFFSLFKLGMKRVLSLTSPASHFSWNK